MIKAARLSLVVALAIVLLDQCSKAWAVRDLSNGRVIHVFWTMQLNLTYNRGMAFSRGTGMGPVIGAIGLPVVLV